MAINRASKVLTLTQSTRSSHLILGINIPDQQLVANQEEIFSEGTCPRYSKTDHESKRCPFSGWCATIVKKWVTFKRSAWRRKSNSLPKLFQSIPPEQLRPLMQFDKYDNLYKLTAMTSSSKWTQVWGTISIEVLCIDGAIQSCQQENKSQSHEKGTTVVQRLWKIMQCCNIHVVIILCMEKKRRNKLYWEGIRTHVYPLHFM